MQTEAPDCNNCPWKSFCGTYKYQHLLTKLTVKKPNKIIPTKVIGIGIIFNENGEVLIDQRLEDGLLGGLWEFPGGKQEPNEKIQQTIYREIKEELKLEVEVNELLISFVHSYSHFKVNLNVYICRWLSGDPKPLASQKVCWVYPKDLMQYPFPAANTKIISALIKYLQEVKK